MSDISLATAESELSVEMIDAGSRRFMVERMTMIFIRGNLFMWMSIGVFTLIDCLNMWVVGTPASERLVTTEVVYSLVGATVVQLGLIMVTISRNIFPGQSTEG